MPMADTQILTLCILWEDELRAAAKLLHEVPTISDDDERAQAMVTAYRACAVALHGLTDDKVVVMISARELIKKVLT